MGIWPSVGRNSLSIPLTERFEKRKKREEDEREQQRQLDELKERHAEVTIGS